MSALGAKGQFEIACVLAFLSPVLVCAYLCMSGAVTFEFRHSHAGLILLALVPVVIPGLWLMARYPRTVVRLRRYLEQIAVGELPDTVSLPADEDDLAAIGGCLRLILDQTRERVQTIHEQPEELVRAERQRVMMESLGAACHHIGQPAQALSLQMDMLAREPLVPRAAARLNEVRESVNSICTIVRKMQRVEDYRTVSYLRKIDAGRDIDILDIESVPGLERMVGARLPAGYSSVAA